MKNYYSRRPQENLGLQIDETRDLQLIRDLFENHNQFILFWKKWISLKSGFCIRMQIKSKLLSSEWYNE